MFGRKAIPITGSYIPINTDFTRKRVAEVAARLDIERRATAAARKEEPHSDATDLDGNERLLVGESSTFFSAVTRAAASETSERVGQVRQLMPAKLETALEQISIRRQVAETQDLVRGDLDGAYASLQRALSALRGFEEGNKRDPFSAKYKDDGLMNSASLAALTIGESSFNAFAFEQMQDQGLLGGLLLALMVSVINVVMGVGTGWLGWRLMAHIRWSHKLLGTLVTALLMSAALALHLALGHLREAINNDPKATIDFLVILTPSQWFSFTGVMPFTVIAIGMATFVFAAFKGHSGIAAPYWGHEIVDREYRKAARVFSDTRDNLINGLMNAFDSERAKLRARLDDDVLHVAQIRKLVAEGEAIKRSLGDSIEEEIERLHIWLRMYRDRNRAVRATPAPAYFETYPEFKEWRSTRLDITELKQLAAEAEEVLAANTARLAELEEKTLQEQKAMIDAIPTMVAASERRAAQQIEKEDGPGRPRKQ